MIPEPASLQGMDTPWTGTWSCCRTRALVRTHRQWEGHWPRVPTLGRGEKARWYHGAARGQVQARQKPLIETSAEQSSSNQLLTHQVKSSKPRSRVQKGSLH